MFILSFLPLLASLVILYILAYVIGQRKRHEANRAFVLLFIDLFILNFLEFFVRINSAHPSTATVLLHLTGFFGAFNGFLFLNFVCAVAQKERGKGLLVWGGIALSGAILSLLPGNAFATQVPGPLGFEYIPSAFFIAMVFVAIIPPEIFAFIIAINTYYRSKDDRVKREIVFLLFGTLSAGAFYITIVLLLTFLLHWPQGTLFSSTAFTVFALVLFRAITKHKFLSFDIAQIQNVSKRLFSNMRDAVVVLDSQGRAIEANNAALDFFRVELPRLNRDAIVRRIPDYRFNEAYCDNRFTLSTGDASMTIILTQSTVSESDASMGRILVIRDITGDVRIEQELSRARQIESLGLLAGGIAHDFNNLLTGILGSFSLIQTAANGNDDVCRVADLGKKASQQAAALTHRLLTFAKGGEPVKEAINLRDLIIENVTFALHGSNCLSSISIPDETTTIIADRGQMAQVFQNLSINAIQAMPGGGTISVVGTQMRLSEHDGLPLPQGEYIRILFSDEGSGIAPENRSRIFTPYFTTKSKGSGLGLATCYSILKKHGGHITLPLKQEKGVTFSIYLPYSSSPLTKKEAAAGDSFSGKGAVLVVDDELFVRQALSAMLTHIGFSVETARNGDDALRAFEDSERRGNDFVLCIIDLTMPGGISGKQLGELLLERNPAQKIIISSGYHEDTVMANFTDFGFAGVLPKPFDVDAIKSVISRVLKPAASPANSSGTIA